MSSPPSTLGQYQIIREIARSNDIVYEAYDPLMNRRVAVKELAMPAGMTDAQKADRISRFKREAQAAGTLNHANIMTVYSFAEEAGRIFMAMEYLDGHTLRNEVDTKGFIPIDRATEIAIAVLEGLSHAHSKGVIHRDIKPDNIQVLGNGEVKITDFGIARLTFQPNLTMDGQVFGTPSYMSPEQVVGREIDARSDLFSVAIVLYEMISGQKPFAGDSVVSITYAIMNKEPQQPSQATWSLWQVLSRALDKSPQLRYASATEMIEALRDANRQAQSGTMTSSYNPPAASNTGVYSPSTQYGTPNPYAPPVAAPAPFNPYGQPPSPYPSAYNPYQPQPPVVQQQQTPYGTYAPYQPQNVAYPQMPSMAPPGPLPVYYPPPPRDPLLKPETSLFIRKLLITIIVVGTLFALIFVGISSAVKTIQQASTSKKDTQIAGLIASLDPHIPIQERVNKAEKLLNELPPNARSQAGHNAAVLYEQLGKQLIEQGHGVDAEVCFQRGVDLDQTNPRLYSDLGGLYYTMAGTSQNASDQVTLLQKSAQAWTSAMQEEVDPTRRASYGDGAAQAVYSSSQIMLQSPDVKRADIRKSLEDARSMTGPDSSVRKSIDQLLESIR